MIYVLFQSIKMKLIQSFPPLKTWMGKLSYTLKHFLTIKVPIKRKLLNCLQECTSKKLWKSQYGNKISTINITLPNKVIFIYAYYRDTQYDSSWLFGSILIYNQ